MAISGIRHKGDFEEGRQLLTGLEGGDENVAVRGCS